MIITVGLVSHYRIFLFLSTSLMLAGRPEFIVQSSNPGSFLQYWGKNQVLTGNLVAISGLPVYLFDLKWLLCAFVHC
jgi:hypothetical protein